MYLIKFVLDITKKNVRKALEDCSEMHRDIQHMFGCARKDAEVLFRLVETSGAPAIYVYASKPLGEESTLISGYKLVGCKEVEPMLGSLEKGCQIRFNLVAYPSKKVRGAGKNSKRVFLTGKDSQLAWLDRQAKNNGFRIVDASISEGISDSVKVTSKAVPLVFNRVCFHGVIEISDREKFLAALSHGIGPEKAYGMGMLMIG